MDRKLFAPFLLIMAMATVACTTTTTLPESAAEIVAPTQEVADVVQEVSTKENETIAATELPILEEPATPTAAPTAIPTEPPTPTALPEETAEAVDTEESDQVAEAESSPVIYGRTSEGAFFYGSETAEVTIIDHSDFL